MYLFVTCACVATDALLVTLNAAVPPDTVTGLPLSVMLWMGACAPAVARLMTPALLLAAAGNAAHVCVDPAAVPVANWPVAQLPMPALLVLG